MEEELEFHPIDMETLSKNLKYEHLLVDGMYMRIMNVSKSICIQGATHLKPGFAIMLKGSMIIREDLVGKEAEVVITAPSVFMVPAGSKKYGIALEDCSFATIERTDNVELDVIEKELYKEELVTSNLIGYNKNILMLGE